MCVQQPPWRFVALNACPQSPSRAHQCACCATAVGEAFWGAPFVYPIRGSNDGPADYKGDVWTLSPVFYGHLRLRLR